MEEDSNNSTKIATWVAVGLIILSILSCVVFFLILFISTMERTSSKSERISMWISFGMSILSSIIGILIVVFYIYSGQSELPNIF